MIKFLFLLFFLSSSSMGAWGDLDFAVDNSLPFKDAIEVADLIVVGQTERVEVIGPEPVEHFDRRALVKVLKIFKGKKPRGELFIYYRSKPPSTSMAVPNALLRSGSHAVLFIRGTGQKKVAYEPNGSFGLYRYPQNLKNEPKKVYCKYKALEAYSEKKPIEEVVKTSFECPYPRMLNNKVKK